LILPLNVFFHLMDAPYHFLALVVLRMGFAGIDDLERSRIAGDFQRSACVPEQQLGAFVDCCPPREA
jgi:hypothetical protein